MTSVVKNIGLAEMVSNLQDIKQNLCIKNMYESAPAFFIAVDKFKQANKCNISSTINFILGDCFRNMNGVVRAKPGQEITLENIFIQAVDSGLTQSLAGWKKDDNDFNQTQVFNAIYNIISIRTNLCNKVIADDLINSNVFEQKVR